MKPELADECKYCKYEASPDCGLQNEVCFGFCPKQEVIEKLHQELTKPASD